MAGPDPATTEWVPVWNPVAIGPPGPAGGAVADATYWLKNPHVSLPAARALSGLGTGYVRSTAGEPSVVPTIPLTDTTGILPDDRLTSNVALKNINNFFVVQTFTSWSIIQGANHALVFSSPADPVDQKLWRFLTYGDGTMHFEAMDDLQSTAIARFSFNRSGAFSAPFLQGQGQNVTNLNASYLAYGTVPLARLGTNAPTSALYLRGDNTWATPAADAFPSGMIVLSIDTPCPPGWTRVTTLDGRFMRVGPGGQGGSTSHSHGMGTMQVPAHGHGNTGDAGNHNHAVSMSGNFGSGINIGGEMNVDAGGSGVMARSTHTHTTLVAFNVNTGDAGNHNHGIPNAGAIALTGAMAAADNIPPYSDFFLCRKN